MITNGIKKTTSRNLSFFFGGEDGIRTHVGCPKRFSRPPRYDHFDTSPYLTMVFYHIYKVLSIINFNFLKIICRFTIDVLQMLIKKYSLKYRVTKAEEVFKDFLCFFKVRLLKYRYIFYTLFGYNTMLCKTHIKC